MLLHLPRLEVALCSALYYTNRDSLSPKVSAAVNALWHARWLSDKLGHNDGNKSLYLVFMGVVFLSILDCFYSS
jgi:hypothetical protein